jgi:hypothetical protein
MSAQWRVEVEEIEGNLTFDFYVGKFLVHQFTPEECAIDWAALAAACRNGTNNKHDWSPSNGETLVSVSDGVLKMNVAKCGDGRGGDKVGFAPASACVAAFERAQELMDNWLDSDREETQ